MSQTIVLLDQYRHKLADRTLTGGVIPKPTHVAFGDGGHNANLTPKDVEPDRTALFSERLRKPLFLLAQDEPGTVTGTGVVEANELVGLAVSEVALIDQDGDLIGMKTYGPKVKEYDERYEMALTIKF